MKSENESSESTASESSNDSSSQAKDSASTSENSTPTQTSSDSDGQKYVDGIPYDVFFDRPLNVAADDTNLAPGETATPRMANNASTSANPAPDTPEPDTATKEVSDDWGDVIPQERLIEEVTHMRNSLTADLNSVGNFNRELLNIQIDGATLAALAGIATMHPGDFTWKDKAHFVRDMAAEIATAAESRGRPAFEKAETNYLNIIDILNGGSPAGLPESEKETVFPEVADRNLLMKQIKENNDWLRTTISNEGDFSSNKQEIISRASLLKAIGHVVKQEDYIFADEQEYQDYCKELINGAAQMVKASENDDYAQYDKGFQLMGKSCNDCHPVYFN